MKIAVDLDATLAVYKDWPTNGLNIGKPIEPMKERVLDWLADGVEVVIFTARVCTNDPVQIDLINAWCLAHLGTMLPITATKSLDINEFWDDRAVSMIPNTGQINTTGKRYHADRA